MKYYLRLIIEKHKDITFVNDSEGEMLSAEENFHKLISGEIKYINLTKSGEILTHWYIRDKHITILKEEK